MAHNVYECMFIFNANAYARNPAGAAKNIEELITSVDGEVLASRLFEERKLAYPINGHRKGVYWLAYAKLDSSVITKLNRSCKLNDIIMRHLVVKIDPRLVDAMVSVAQGKVPAASAPAKEAAKAPAEAAKAPAEAAAKS